jgi:hypothetical protein
LLSHPTAPKEVHVYTKASETEMLPHPQDTDLKQESIIMEEATHAKEQQSLDTEEHEVSLWLAWQTS